MLDLERFSYLWWLRVGWGKSFHLLISAALSGILTLGEFLHVADGHDPRGGSPQPSGLRDAGENRA